MRKLTIESLRVESFATTAGGTPARGTVLGHNAATPGTDDPAVCGGPTAFKNCTAGCSPGCTMGCPYGTVDVCA